MDAELGRLLQTADPRVRRRLSLGIQHRLYDDVPMIVMYERSGLDAYVSRLRGYRPNAYEDFYRAEGLEL